MKSIKVEFCLLIAILTATASETAYAVIQDGVVTNTIVDAHYPGSPRIDTVTPQPGIGWGYDGTTWTAPQTFAIVTGGVVTQVATGLPSTISTQYSGAIRVDNLNPVPDVGWTSDGTTFTAPSK